MSGIENVRGQSSNVRPHFRKNRGQTRNAEQQTAIVYRQIIIEKRQKNMLVEIREFGMSWNPATKQGEIILHLENGQAPKVPVSSAEEFAAIALILGETPIFLDTDNGRIQTKWEAPG
jgi:hypothetical protein